MEGEIPVSIELYDDNLKREVVGERDRKKDLLESRDSRRGECVRETGK